MKHILFSLCCIFLLVSCSTQKNTLSRQSVDVPELQNLQKDAAILQDTTMMPDDTNMMQKEDTMMEKSDSMQKDSMTSDDKMMKDNKILEEETTMMNTGVYTTYAPELVGKTKNTVLFFYAAWCPNCRAADSGILSGKVPDDLSILKVDYDKSDDLRRKYEVLSQHTFVQVDAQGNMIKKWAGGTKIDDIVESIN